MWNGNYFIWIFWKILFLLSGSNFPDSRINLCIDLEKALASGNLVYRGPKAVSPETYQKRLRPSLRYILGRRMGAVRCWAVKGCWWAEAVRGAVYSHGLFSVFSQLAFAISLSFIHEHWWCEAVIRFAVWLLAVGSINVAVAQFYRYMPSQCWVYCFSCYAQKLKQDYSDVIVPILFIDFLQNVTRNGAS